MCFTHRWASFADMVREMQGFFFVRPGCEETKAAEPVRPYSDNLVGTKAELKQY